MNVKHVGTYNNYWTTRTLAGRRNPPGKDDLTNRISSTGIIFAVRSRLDHHRNPSLLTIKRASFSVSLDVDLRRPKCQSDHSPPFSAVIKNAWSFNSIAQHILLA